MPKAYSYLRFSRPEQAQGDSFRRQYEGAQKYAAEHGLDLDETLTLHDLGVSAYRSQHVETGCLGEFVRAVEEGMVEPGSYLLVESLDRISRDAAIDAIYLLKRICQGGVTVVTLLDQREYTIESLRHDTTSILVSLLTFIRAHEESATKATRLKKAWNKKRLNIGEKPLTARAPYWLRLNKETCAFEVIEDRAELVRQMFNLYLGGMGPAGIAKQFNSQGLPAWGRGRLWYESYVIKILENSAVYGVTTPHRLEHENGKKKRVPLESVAGYFPVIVDEETFLRAQEVKSSKGVKGRKVSIPLRNAFTKLARCPVCGSTMIRVNKGETSQYLVCSAAKNGVKACKYRSVPYDRLEASFIKAVRDGLQIPVDLVKLELIESSITESEARMNKAIQERSNLIDAIKSGTLRHEQVTIESVPRPVITGIIDEVAIYAEKWGPFTLRDEIELLDQTVEENRRKIVKAKGDINLIRPAAIEARLKELEVLACAQDLDRVKFNAALRAICSKVVIQYDYETADLHFKHSDRILSVSVQTRGGAA